MTLEQKLLELKEQARSNKETSIPNSVNYRVYLHKEKAYDQALTLAKEAKEELIGWLEDICSNENKKLHDEVYRAVEETLGFKPQCSEGTCVVAKRRTASKDRKEG